MCVVEVSDERFDQLVEQAIELIPPELRRHVHNVAMFVDDYNPDSPYILGLYDGVALTERTSDYSMHLPPSITLYAEALKDFCASEEQLREQIAITVVHEVAHHFGIDDDRLHELGWG